MHKKSCFWKLETAEICRKALLSYVLIIMSQTKLEKVIFIQIWDFRAAC